MAYPDANPKKSRTVSRTFSKSRQNPNFPDFHFLTYSLSDTGLVHGRRLKRLQERHGPLIQGQHEKNGNRPSPPTGLQSLIPEQPAPQLKGSSQVLFTYSIYVKVSCYPAPRCEGIRWRSLELTSSCPQAHVALPPLKQDPRDCRESS